MKTPFEIFLVTGGFFVLVVRGWVRRFTAGTGFGIPPGCLCERIFRVWFIGFNAGGVGGFGREPVKIIRWDFFVGRRWWRFNGSEKHNGTVVLMVRKNRIISSAQSRILIDQNCQPGPRLTCHLPLKKDLQFNRVAKLSKSLTFTAKLSIYLSCAIAVV